MEEYKVRSGIVQVNICGVKLLIPTRKASEKCNQYQQLSFMSSAVWQMLVKQKTKSEICEMYQKFTQKNDSEAQIAVESILSNFAKKGFLILQGEQECD